MDMKRHIDRRDFLKTSATAAAAATVAACAPGKVRELLSDDGSRDDSGEMTCRTDPRTGAKVSLLGYGCMRWPMTEEDGKSEIDQEKVNELVDYAIEHGVNYFDTAPVYIQGKSESATAEALSRHPRESYYIATKLSNFSNYTRENSILMYRKSLENLRTDHIDYYLLHAIGNGGIDLYKKRFVDNGMIDFLMKEREEGRIRHLGFSFHGNKETFDYLMEQHEAIHWDFVQIQYNWVDAKHANPTAGYLYDELAKREIPSVIMEPLLGGRLSKVPEHIATRLKEKAPSSSVASWAFRFAGTPEKVLTVLSGMTYMEHLEDNIRTYSPLKPLDDGEIKYLSETSDLLKKYPTVPCNDCKYCMPCPYGLDIPAILLHYNKCVNEGLVSADTSDPAYRKARRAYLIGYNRAVPRERQAERCINCNECVSHCPQKIRIPHELSKINNYIEELKKGL
ncbi:MAG: aldo/keto reductase [Bacteroidales bacterium]|nr:aldo/keto reductase [Bacteroidales bacterium]